MKHLLSKAVSSFCMLFIVAISTSCGDDINSNDKYNTLHSNDAIELQDAITNADISNTSPLYEGSREDNFDPNLDGTDRLDSEPNSHLTHGSGGREGSFEARFTSSGSYIATSYYKMRVPEGIHTKEPHGLLVYLHGDGGNDYTNDWIFAPIAKLAHAHNLIAMSVLSPNNGTAWYQGPQTNAYFLHKLLEDKVFHDYNIDTTRIYFTGSSGGSQFLTGIFVPKYATNYGGGAFPSCGGADIYNFIDYQISDYMKEHFKIYYYTQTGDFLYPQVVKSKERYTSLGMKVGGEFPRTCRSSRCHCEFNLSEVMVKALDFFDHN